MSLREHFASVLRAALQARGITQAELARRQGLAVID